MKRVLTIAVLPIMLLAAISLVGCDDPSPYEGWDCSDCEQLPEINQDECLIVCVGEV